MSLAFWQDKSVFITGHTGFKGAWLSLWLQSLGAQVTGYALTAPTNPSLFNLLQLEQSMCKSITADIREYDCLQRALQDAKPEVVMHLAAQPLVRESYAHPVETYDVNIMGTVHLLEAVRHTPSVKAVVIVTSDKAYANQEWTWGYRETDTLGGSDPYASSKACAELVTEAYVQSYFHPDRYDYHGVAIANARAGNVVGGGDWAKDRLVPDLMRAVETHVPIVIRNPQAIRPWQHVLEPLQGYLTLAQNLYEQGTTFMGAWNFGPDPNNAKPVEWVVDRLCNQLGHTPGFHVDGTPQPHETTFLRLDSSKAIQGLGWEPKWNVETTIDKVAHWYEGYFRGYNVEQLCMEEIADYCEATLL